MISSTGYKLEFRLLAVAYDKNQGATLALRPDNKGKYLCKYVCVSSPSIGGKFLVIERKLDVDTAISDG